MRELRQFILSSHDHLRSRSRVLSEHAEHQQEVEVRALRQQE
jgi:hypothetical protein